MQNLAQGWLVWRMTNSPFWLGVVSAVSQLPSLLFGSIGGVIVDRHTRRKVLFITQSGLALTAGALAVATYSGHIQVWQIVLIAGISGIFASIDAPARLSFIQDLVGKEDIGNAVALNSTTFNAARLIGPSIAGFLVPIIGEAGCFAFNSASFVALIISLFFMSNLPPPMNRKHRSVGHEWREAFHYLRTTPVPRTLILNTIMFGGFGFSYTAMMPQYADKFLGVGVRGLGMLMGTVGTGALLGGLWQATLPSGSKRGWLVMYGAIGLSCSLFVFSLSRTLILSLPFLLLMGFSSISMLASTNTLLQTIAPDHLRGRVMGFYTTCFLGVAPIGFFVVGSVASKIGTQYALASIALLCLVFALFTIVPNRDIRKV